MPRAPDPGARNESARRGRLCGPMRDGEEWGGLRGSASYTALPCSEPPSNPPALGLGGRRGHTRRPRELAGAVGEVATPCTDGRPSENTPPWLGLHQSSLPNAAKGYCRRTAGSKRNRSERTATAVRGTTRCPTKGEQLAPRQDTEGKRKPTLLTQAVSDASISTRIRTY